MPIDVNEPILLLFHGWDIVQAFKNAYYREPTEEEYNAIKYQATDKWDTDWITESLQESVWDTIIYLEEKGELPKMPPLQRDIIKSVEHLTKIAEERKDLYPNKHNDLDCTIYFAVMKALNNIEEKYGIRYDRERVQN